MGILTGIESHNKYRLIWDAATDNIGVDHYVIFKNTGVEATVAGNILTYEMNGTHPGDTFFVVAADAAGNTSNPSNTVTR